MVDELDESLIHRWQSGDQQAFRSIIDHHLGPLSHFVRRMISEPDEADDILQETFIRLWHTRDRYRPERSRLSTWLHRIAHNLCIDSVRRSRRHLPISSEVETDPCGPAVSHESQRQAQQLQSALMQLPEHQRSAIVLTHYQGLSQKEVAGILEISVDALESLLRRTRSRLKSILQEDHS